MLRREDLIKNLFQVVVDGNVMMKTRIAYGGNGEVEYVGIAPAGADAADGCWLIRKMVYDGSNRIIETRHAGGTDTFDKVWNDRAGYVYL